MPTNPSRLGLPPPGPHFPDLGGEARQPGGLFEITVEDDAWLALAPGQRRQRTFEAVKRIILREAREQPVALIVEDLHWVDAETQALLDNFVESIGSARLLLVVNYRPGYQHPWTPKTYYSQVRLDALPSHGTEELLGALLGGDPSLETLKRALVKRGNPFFLEETVRTLAETKVLEGERGAFRLVKPAAALQIPSTVQAVLAARIDRLDPDDKELLQVASVIGKDVSLPILGAIAALPEETLRQRLARLQAGEFLYETGGLSEGEFSFKHSSRRRWRTPAW